MKAVDAVLVGHVRIWLVSASLFVIACTDASNQEPEYEVYVGAIMYAFDEATHAATVPRDVVPGQPFNVSFVTWGSPCETPLSVDVVETESVIRITPYDQYLIPGPQEACPSSLLEYERRVELLVGEAGAYVVDLRGRPATNADPDDIVSVEYIVNARE